MSPPSTARTNSRRASSSPSATSRRHLHPRSSQRQSRPQPEIETRQPRRDTPRHIPGFYYDEARQRYFRIQENHLVPRTSSPTSELSTQASSLAAAKYTVQAVTAVERDKAERRERVELEVGRKRRCVKRDRWVCDPVSGLDLGVRLGSGGGGVWGRLGGGRGFGEGVRRQYARMLQRNTLVDLGNPGPKFVVENRSEVGGGGGGGSRALFTTASIAGRWEGGRELCVTPLTFAVSESTTEEADEFSRQRWGGGGQNDEEEKSNGDQGDGERRPIYDPTTTVPILHAGEITAMLPLGNSLMMWSSLRPGTNERGGSEASQLCLSRRYDSESVPWRTWRDEFGDWATQVNQLQTVVWDIAAPQSWSGGRVVMATGNGIRIGEIDGGGMSYVATPTTRLKDGAVASSERMVVGFKDEWVYMAGDRRGDVVLGDLRGASAVERIRSRSGVTALRRLRNDNTILVSGMEKMTVHDLRFNRVNYVQGRESHWAQPVLDFNVPHSMQQKRYGMGFDYDEELNIVASASTNFGADTKVGLWDVTTGKRIEDGMLAKKVFEKPVTCLQMVDLRGDGHGRKSILTTSGGVIEEWYV